MSQRALVEEPCFIRKLKLGVFLMEVIHTAGPQSLTVISGGLDLWSETEQDQKGSFLANIAP